MSRLRSFVRGAALLLAIAVAAPSAQAETLQIKAAPGDLPPGHILSTMFYSPAMRDAVLNELKLELIEQLKVQQNLGGTVLKFKDAQGNEQQVVFSAVVVEEGKEPDVYWGLLNIYPYQDESIHRTNDQEKELTQLCGKMTAAWAKQLEVALNRFVSGGNHRKESLEQSSMRAQQRFAVATKELDVLRQSLREREIQVSMPAVVLESQLTAAMSQLQSLELELAGLESRHKALEAWIAKMGKETAEQAQGDEVVKNLQEVVDLRTQELEIVRRAVDVGRSAPGDVEKAAVELATARAELAQAQQDAHTVKNAGTFTWLNNELTQCTIRQEECRGRLEFAQKRAEKLAVELRLESSEVQPLREKVGMMARRVEMLVDAMFDAELEQERAESQRQPVVVRLLLPSAEEAAASEESK